MQPTERSSAQSYFWPTVLAVGLHVIIFGMLFVSFAMTPDLPPSKPIVQATLYQLKSQSQATTQTNQKLAGEAQKTAAKQYEAEQLEQRKIEQEKQAAAAAEQKKAADARKAEAAKAEAAKAEAAKKAADAKKAEEARKVAEQKKQAEIARKKAADEAAKKKAADEAAKKKAAEEAKKKAAEEAKKKRLPRLRRKKLPKRPRRKRPPRLHAKLRKTGKRRHLPSCSPTIPSASRPWPIPRATRWPATSTTSSVCERRRVGPDRHRRAITCR